MTNFAQRSNMKIYNNILETIGNTPIVRINKLAKDVPAQVFAKVETTNPGNSVKDRMALKMIEDAEKSGLLKPGMNYRDWETDRKSTRLNSSHLKLSRMPSSA